MFKRVQFLFLFRDVIDRKVYFHFRSVLIQLDALFVHKNYFSLKIAIFC